MLYNEVEWYIVQYITEAKLSGILIIIHEAKLSDLCLIYHSAELHNMIIPRQCFMDYYQIYSFLMA